MIRNTVDAIRAARMNKPTRPQLQRRPIPHGGGRQMQPENITRLFAASDTLTLYRQLRRSLAAVNSMMKALVDSEDRHGRLQVIAGQLQTAREVVKRWIETEEALTR
jgi:hypothetical protein